MQDVEQFGRSLTGQTNISTLHKRLLFANGYSDAELNRSITTGWGDVCMQTNWIDHGPTNAKSAYVSGWKAFVTVRRQHVNRGRQS